MIASIRCKGLRRFHATGCASGIRPDQAKRVAAVLDKLDCARSLECLRGAELVQYH